MIGLIAIKVIVWFLCLAIAIWTGGMRHKHASLGVRFTIIAIFLGWFAGKALIADLGLWAFPSAFPTDVSSPEVILPKSAIEILAFIGLFVFALVLQRKVQRYDNDPLAEVKRIESDKKRWIKANGE